MTIFRCDRCHTHSQEAPINQITLYHTERVGSSVWDICDVCKDELIEWMRAQPTQVSTEWNRKK